MKRYGEKKRKNEKNEEKMRLLGKDIFVFAFLTFFDLCKNKAQGI